MAVVSDVKFFGWVQLSIMYVCVCVLMLTLGECYNLNLESRPLYLLVIFLVFYIRIIRCSEALLDLAGLPSVI